MVFEWDGLAIGLGLKDLTGTTVLPLKNNIVQIEK